MAAAEDQRAGTVHGAGETGRACAERQEGRRQQQEKGRQTCKAHPARQRDGEARPGVCRRMAQDEQADGAAGKDGGDLTA